MAKIEKQLQVSPQLREVQAELSSLLCFFRLEFFGQKRNDLVEITDDTIVSDIEDRCVFILVNSDDVIGFFHTCDMLDGTGDTDCKVDLRTNRLTGLSYLEFLRQPAGINHCT